MRQKSLEFSYRLSNREIGSYGFPSKKYPSTVLELSTFELDVLMIIKNAENLQVCFNQICRKIFKQLNNQKICLFQLITGQILTSWRRIIAISNLGETLSKHTKNRES